MPHYLDEYAPLTGRWKAPSGRRYDLIEVDPSKAKLAPGRPYAAAASEKAAALFFGFVPVADRKEVKTKTSKEVTAAKQLVNQLLSTGAKEVIYPVVVGGEDFEVVVRRKEKLSG